MFYIKIIIFLMMPQYIFALPVLKGKQSLDNIRFISQDGKFTYYQRRSGKLQISTNYSNKEVLDGKKYTQYFIHSSPARKRILIEKDEAFYQEMGIHKVNKIFTADYGQSEAKFVANATSPRLHRDDSYISLFYPREKNIGVRKAGDSKDSVLIKLRNPLNPSFSPVVLMPTPNDVLYTDINKDGNQAFLMYSILENKMQTVYKASYPGSKLEGCIVGEDLIVGEFAQVENSSGSKIIKIPLFNNESYQKMNIIYQNQASDLGNMLCEHNKVFFIKTLSYNKKLNLKETEVASIDLGKNNLSIISDLEYVTQLISMDGMVLAPLRGKYYIVHGKKSVVDDGLKRDKNK